MKFCKECNSILKPKRGGNRIRSNRIYCNKKCASKFIDRKNYYDKYRNDPIILARKKKEMSRWYKKNKERQYEHVYRYYKENKNKWNERRFVNNHKDQILSILPKKCFSCRKKKVKEIHHETYEFEEKRKMGHQQNFEKYLINYCKTLKGFCSKNCHRKYHKNQNDKIRKKFKGKKDFGI